MNDKVIPFDKPVRIKVIDDAVDDISPLILQGALIIYELMHLGEVKNYKNLRAEIQAVWDSTEVVCLDDFSVEPQSKRLWAYFMDVWDQAFTAVYYKVDASDWDKFPSSYKYFQDQDFVIDFIVARIDEVKNGYRWNDDL